MSREHLKITKKMVKSAFMEVERTTIELKIPFWGVKHNNLQKIKSLI